MNPALALLMQAKAAASAWTPAGLSGLAAWYDASDASTITDAGGGAVSAWNDKSGNARHLTQGTPAARPITGSVAIGASNALSFDGVDDFMALPGLSFTADTITVAMVASNAAASRSGFHGGAATNQPGLYQKVSGGTSFGVEPQTEYQFTMADSSPGRLLILSHGPNQFVRVNGVALSTSPGAPASVVGKAITGVGRLMRTNIYLTGAIGEFLVIDRVPDAAEIANLESYLMTKWGLS